MDSISKETFENLLTEYKKLYSSAVSGSLEEQAYYWIVSQINSQLAGKKVELLSSELTKTIGVVKFFFRNPINETEHARAKARLEIFSTFAQRLGMATDKKWDFLSVGDLVRFEESEGNIVIVHVKEIGKGFIKLAVPNDPGGYYLTTGEKVEKVEYK